jgi:hypothetical protein
MPAQSGVMMYPLSAHVWSPRLRIIGCSLSPRVPPQRRSRVILFVRLNSINWQADPLHTCAHRRLPSRGRRSKQRRSQQKAASRTCECSLLRTPHDAASRHILTTRPHARTPERHERHARTHPSFRARTDSRTHANHPNFTSFTSALQRRPQLFSDGACPAISLHLASS